MPGLLLNSEVLLPFVGDVAADDQVVDARSLWLEQELHARLVGGAATLALVAGVAGAGSVAPGVTAAARTRNDVVYREIFAAEETAVLALAWLQPAVDAGVAVSAQDAPLRPGDVALRYVDKARQPDHRRDFKDSIRRAQFAGYSFNRLHLTGQKQVDSPLDADHLQRFVGYVEKQDAFHSILVINKKSPAIAGEALIYLIKPNTRTCLLDENGTRHKGYYSKGTQRRDVNRRLACASFEYVTCFLADYCHYHCDFSNNSPSREL